MNFPRGLPTQLIDKFFALFLEEDHDLVVITCSAFKLVTIIVVRVYLPSEGG